MTAPGEAGETVQNPALLAAVIEDPADDAPRLAYADWLKKNGDPDRAEFIRVQCRRAARAEDDPTQAGLQKKEKALLKKHGARWTDELPGWARGGAVFRRGFVAELGIPLGEFAARGAELLRVTPLESIRLFQEGVTNKDVKALAKCPHAARLTGLSLWYSEISDPGARALAAAPHLAGLRTLEIGHAFLTDEGLAALAGSPHLKGLTTLNLATNEITAAGLQALATAPWRLESLDLANNPLGDHGIAQLAATQSLASLTRLDVSGCEVGPAGATALASSPHLAGLRFLGLGQNRPSAEGVAAVAGSPVFAGLRELWIENSRLDDAAARALVRSPHLTGLRRLVLVNNEITEVAWQELARRFGEAITA